MKWILVCDDDYEPIDGQNHVVYMSDEGCILAVSKREE